MGVQDQDKGPVPTGFHRQIPEGRDRAGFCAGGKIRLVPRLVRQPEGKKGEGGGSCLPVLLLRLGFFCFIL